MTSVEKNSHIIRDLLAEAESFLHTDPERGIDLAIEALERAQQCQLPHFERKAQWTLSQLYWKSNKLEQALQIAQKLQISNLSKKEQFEIAKFIGQIAVKLQKPRIAEQHLQEALRLASDMSFPDEMLFDLYVDLGLAQKMQGKGKESLASYMAAYQHLTEKISPKQRAFLFRCIGMSMLVQAKYQEAIEWFNRSLSIRQQLHDVRGYAITLTNLGYAYSGAGQFYRAYRILLEALEHHTKHNDTIMLLSTNAALGYLFNRLQQYEDALQYYSTALQLAEREKLKDRKAKILNNIGEIYRSRQEWKLARYHYAKALRLYRQISPSHLDIPVVLANIGLTFKEEGKLSQAARALQFALHLLEIPNDELFFGVKLALAEIYVSQKAYSKAEEQLREISDLLSNDTISLQYRATYYRLRSLLAEQYGNSSEALHFLKSAFQAEIAYRDSRRIEQIQRMKFQYQLQQEKEQLQTLQQKNAELVFITELLKETNAKLEGQKQAVTNMLNLCTHDIKNHILALNLSIEKLQKLGIEKSLLADITSTVEDMKELVRSVIESEHLFQYAIIPSSEIVQLDQFLQQAIHPLRVLAESKNVKIKLLLHDPDIRFPTHPRWCTQILQNLLSNAIKYSPVGGTVEISSTIEELFLILAIADQGPGIPYEEQKNLFQPRTRLSTAIPDSFQSSGLGLYLSKQLANILNYQLTFSSTPGSGTTFFVKIPLSNRTFPQEKHSNHR